MTALVALWLALQGPVQPGGEVATAPKLYGDQGSSHLGLILGLGGGDGGFRWQGGIDYGYFAIDGVAPGIDAEVWGGSGRLTTGMVLGTLRLVPLRLPSFAFYIVGKAGRVFVASHEDGWATGGGGGIIFFTGGRLGVTLGYDALWLSPKTFCGDDCLQHGLQGGIVAGF